MNSKISFYSIVSVLLLVSGYIGYRLLFRAGPEVTKHTETPLNKPASGMRFSQSVTKPAESVWTDPRLKNPVVGNAIGEGLKTSATIENNLKVLTGLYDQGADDEFLRRLKELVAQNPNVKEYAALLGDYYYNEGKWPEAEAAVKKLIELDPNNMFAKTSLAEILSVQGRYDDGQQMNEQVLSADPRNIDAMYGLVAGADMKGASPEIGIKPIEEIYNRDQSNGNAAAVIAESYYSQNKTVEAYKIINDAVKRDPENPVLLRTASKLAAQQGNFQQSADWAEAAALRATDVNQKVEAWTIAWHAHLELNQFDAAEKAINAILADQPQNEMARQALQTVNLRRSIGSK